MSTPFDLESANFLNDLMEVFKISSSDITNSHLLIILVVINQLSSLLEHQILMIIEAVLDNPKIQLALLHCVLNYPTENRNAHL